MSKSKHIFKTGYVILNKVELGEVGKNRVSGTGQG